MTVPTVTLSNFCAWRARRAHLTGGSDQEKESLEIEQIVEDTGWPLATGASAPYLTLRIRNAACTRAAVDQAVLKDRRLVRVTSVRGEPHLVPCRHVMTAVAAKGRRIDARIRQIGKVVSISRGEVETLAMAIVEFLADGPATFKELEEGLPAGMLRSFGTEGRRAGVSGVLPVALEYLEEEGRVLQLDSGKRLDEGNRFYSLTEKAFPEHSGAAPDQLEVLPTVLETYLRSLGPARLEDFVWWAGTTLNRARTAAAALENAPVDFRIDGLEGDFVILPGDLESLLDFEPIDEPEVVLVPNRDPFYLGRKTLTAEFMDLETPEKILARFRGKPMAARVLPAVLASGRIVGIWEWVPEEKEIRWALLESDCPQAFSADKLNAAIEKEAAWLSAFIQEDLDGKVVLDPNEYGTHWAYGVDEIRSFW